MLQLLWDFLCQVIWDGIFDCMLRGIRSIGRCARSDFGRSGNGRVAAVERNQIVKKGRVP